MQKYNAIQCSITETSNDQLFCFVLLICCWNWLTCSHSLLPAISIKIRIFIYTEIRHHLDNNSSMFMNSLWVLLQWEKKYRRLKARKNQMSFKFAQIWKLFYQFSLFLYWFNAEESSYGDFHCQIYEMLVQTEMKCNTFSIAKIPFDWILCWYKMILILQFMRLFCRLIWLSIECVLYLSKILTQLLIAMRCKS